MRLPLATLLALTILGGCTAGAAPATPTGQPTPPPPTGTPTLAPTAPPTASPSPSPSPAASPTASPSPTPTGDPSAAFSINLYEEGDWVSQWNDIYCAPAAMQVMMNLMIPGAEAETAETQARLYRMGRELSSERLRGKGVEPQGWAGVLNAEGFGPYVVEARPTLDEAVRLAAISLRRTNRPVGILAWRGAHAWVMSGFESRGDPALTDDFSVSALWIQDVWYPRVSSIWGEPYAPNSLVPLERLPEDFRRYRRPRTKYPEHDGQYVLVVPVEAAS